MICTVHIPGPITIYTTDPAITSKLDEIYNALVKLGDRVMHTLDEILALVTAESTKLDSIKTLIVELKKQLADALSGVILSPEVQAKVDAVFDAAAANATKVEEAINANT